MCLARVIDLVIDQSTFLTNYKSQTKVTKTRIKYLARTIMVNAEYPASLTG